MCLHGRLTELGQAGVVRDHTRLDLRMSLTHVRVRVRVLCVCVCCVVFVCVCVCVLFVCDHCLHGTQARMTPSAAIARLHVSGAVQELIS